MLFLIIRFFITVFFITHFRMVLQNVNVLQSLQKCQILKQKNPD